MRSQDHNVIEVNSSRAWCVINITTVISNDFSLFIACSEIRNEATHSGQLSLLVVRRPTYWLPKKKNKHSSMGMELGGSVYTGAIRYQLEIIAYSSHYVITCCAIRVNI
jgi:hypothetical protein